MVVGCPEGVVDAPVVVVAAACNLRIGLDGLVFVFSSLGIFWVDSLLASALAGFCVGPCGNRVPEIWIWSLIGIEIVVGVGHSCHDRHGYDNQIENVWSLFPNVVSIGVGPDVVDTRVEGVVVYVPWVRGDGAFSSVAEVEVACARLVGFAVPIIGALAAAAVVSVEFVAAAAVVGFGVVAVLVVELRAVAAAAVVVAVAYTC